MYVLNGNGSIFCILDARGGGGGISILTVSGTCRWTGYDFPVITIDTRISKSALLATGGLLRLSQGCFPAGFPAHNVYVRPTISAPASVRAGRNRFFECMMIHSRIESPSVTNEPWINARSRNSLSSPPPPLSLSLSLSQGMHMKSF